MLPKLNCIVPTCPPPRPPPRGRFAVHEAPEAAPCPHRLAERGEIDHADRPAVLVLDGQQRRVEGHTVGERLGAIDRVDDPPPAAGAVNGCFFFAQDGDGGRRPERRRGGKEGRAAGGRGRARGRAPGRVAKGDRGWNRAAAQETAAWRGGLKIMAWVLKVAPLAARAARNIPA